MDWDDILEDDRYDDSEDNKLSYDDDSLFNTEELRIEQIQEILQGHNDCHAYTESELEDERSNHSTRKDVNTGVYIARDIIESNRYITAIKSLNENRICSRNILESARTMLNHHHGDEYEDLYFISSISTTVEKRTDYRENKKEVHPTETMKQLVKDNPYLIISVHNHPDSFLPSATDIKSCFEHKYKYGLVLGHNGSIYQYTTPFERISEKIYDMEQVIFDKKNYELLQKYYREEIPRDDFITAHNELFIKASKNLLDAGVIVKEVLWNDNPRKPRNFKKN